MGIFVQDSFTGPAGPLLGHVGEIGGWQIDPTAGKFQLSTAKPHLDGSGRVHPQDPYYPNGACISDILAPAMNIVFTCTFCVGVISANPSTIYFHPHVIPSGPPGGAYDSYEHGGKFLFYPEQTYVYGPAWGSQASTGLDYVMLPPKPDNGVATLSVEYDFERQVYRVYVDGELVISTTLADVSANPYAVEVPTVPGVFAFEFTAGPGDQTMGVLDLSVGTLPPPTPSGFWTDFVGNISEVA